MSTTQMTIMDTMDRSLWITTGMQSLIRGSRLERNSDIRFLIQMDSNKKVCLARFNEDGLMKKKRF